MRGDSVASSHDLPGHSNMGDEMTPTPQQIREALVVIDRAWHGYANAKEIVQYCLTAMADEAWQLVPTKDTHFIKWHYYPDLPDDDESVIVHGKWNCKDEDIWIDIYSRKHSFHAMDFELWDCNGEQIFGDKRVEWSDSVIRWCYPWNISLTAPAYARIVADVGILLRHASIIGVSQNLFRFLAIRAGAANFSRQRRKKVDCYPYSNIQVTSSHPTWLG